MCFTWVTSYSEWPSFSLCKTAMTIVSSQAPTSLIQLDSLTLQLFIIGMLNQGDSMPQGTLGVLFVQLLSHVRLFVTPSWTAAGQASLSSMPGTLLKLMTIELVMSFNHIILCRPLVLLPSIFPSIRVFSNELALRIRWPKYWNFSFSISPSSEYTGLISHRGDIFYFSQLGEVVTDT